MMRRWRPLVVAGLLVTPVGASAQVLTVEEAVQRSLARHPGISRAEAAVAENAAGVREATASRLPVAQFDGQLMRFQEPMVVAPLHGFDPRTPPVFDRTLGQGGVGVAYTVFDGGQARWRRERAGAARDAADAAVEGQRSAVVAEAVSRYSGVVVAREVAAAHGARVVALERQRERSAQLLEQGRAARVVLLRAEAALSGARAELELALLEQAVAERELARTMGLAADELAGSALLPLAVPGVLEPLDELVQRAHAGSRDLERLRHAVSAAAALRGEAAAQWWPRLQAGGRYVQYGSAAGRESGEWQAGLQLSYTLYSAGARPAASDRAAAAARLARADVELAEQRVAEAVDRAHAAAVGARARRNAWAAAVAQSEEVVRIELLALAAGSGVQADYLEAEAELLRARAEHMRARHAELLARVELARLTGELTAGWVAGNLESDG